MGSTASAVRIWQNSVSATSPTQISSTVRKPSAITVSAMLSTVTPIGTEREVGHHAVAVRRVGRLAVLGGDADEREVELALDRR